MFLVLENLSMPSVLQYGTSVNTNIFFVNAICCFLVPSTQKIPRELKEELSKISNGIKKENVWWGYYQYLDQPYGDWTKFEAWEAIQNGAMLDLIKHHVALLSQYVAEDRLSKLMSGRQLI